MNRIELLQKLRERLLRVAGVREVEDVPQLFYGLDAYLNIVVDSVSWKVAKRIAKAISEVQLEFFHRNGELPALEWDLIEKKDSNRATMLEVKNE